MPTLFNQAIPQEWLIERMRMAGYALDDVCYGFAHMAVQAMLLDDLDTFFQRLEVIAAKPVEEFSQQELPLDIHAFFDGLALYHTPLKYSRILTRNQRIQNADASAPFTQSLQLEKQGGMYPAGFFSGIYSVKDLTRYFAGLQKTVERMDQTRRQTAALVLMSVSHAIAIGYSPKKRGWFFIDVENLRNCSSQNMDDIKSLTMSAFASKETTAFTTRLYGIRKQRFWFDRMAINWRRTPDLRQIQKITQSKLKASDSLQTTWLHLAVQDGHRTAVNALLKSGAKVNTCTQFGDTPLHEAVRANFPDMVKRLLRAKADPNATIGETGMSLLGYAAQYGLVAVARELLQGGATVNTAGSCDQPLFLACRHGHTAMVRLLLAHGADINTSAVMTIKQFKNCFINEHAFVRRRANLFRQRQASLTKPTPDLLITPYQIACIMGYKSVTHLLAERSDPFLSINEDLIQELKEYLLKIKPGVVTTRKNKSQLACYQAAQDLLFLYQCFVHIKPSQLPGAARQGMLGHIAAKMIANSQLMNFGL